MRVASNADGIDYRVRHFANAPLTADATYASVPVEGDSLIISISQLTCKVSHSLSSDRLMHQIVDSTQCARQPEMYNRLSYALNYSLPPVASSV